MKVCIGDKIIAQPTPDFSRSPIYYLNFNVSIKFFNNGVFTTILMVNSPSNFIEIEITEVLFKDYIGKTLLVEYYSGSELIERSYFLISGIYHQFEKSEKLLGLLGENIKKVADQANSWQEGNLREQVITTYKDNDLDEELESYDFSQLFYPGNTPDARFQTYTIKIKETN